MEVIPINEAKTHLSKLVQRASKGERIYLGAYGKAAAMLTPLPKAQPKELGVLSHLAGSFDEDLFNEADQEIIEMFEESINEEIA